MENYEIKEKIAEIRQRYAKLKAICGLRTISPETIAEYAKAIKQLESQLN